MSDKYKHDHEVWQTLYDFARTGTTNISEFKKLLWLSPEDRRVLLGQLRTCFHKTLEALLHPKCKIVVKENQDEGSVVTLESNTDNHPYLRGITLEMQNGSILLSFPGTPDGEFDLRSLPIATKNMESVTDRPQSGDFAMNISPDAGVQFVGIKPVEKYDRHEFAQAIRGLAVLIERYFRKILAEKYESLPPFTLELSRKKAPAPEVLSQPQAPRRSESRNHFEDVAHLMDIADLPTMENIVGHGTPKRELHIAALKFALPELAKEMSVQHEHMILHGPTGNGKTMLVKALVSKIVSMGIKVNFVVVDLNALGLKWKGETERRTRELFIWLRTLSPFVALFDEIDGAIANRDAGRLIDDADEKAIGTILTQIDGMNTLSEGMMIATTNRLHAIDTAVVRPGRFSKLIEVPRLTCEQLLELAVQEIRRLPASIEYGVDGATVRGAISEKAPEWSGADVSSFFGLIRDVAFLERAEKGVDGVLLDNEKFLACLRHYSTLRLNPKNAAVPVSLKDLAMLEQK